MIDKSKLQEIDGMSLDGKSYIIPQDPQTRLDLLNVDRATKEELRLKHRLHVNPDWENTTITTTVVEVLVRVLYSNIINYGLITMSDSNLINFYDLLIVKSTHKVNSKAEKEGNINVKFTIGPKVAELISDDVKREDREYTFISAEAAYRLEDKEQNTIMLQVDKMSRRILADKYAIILPNDYMAIASAYIYLTNLYRELVAKVVLSDKAKATINFNDIIEFNVTKPTKQGDSAIITLTPGYGSKLIIKSDAQSEEEDDEDYD